MFNFTQASSDEAFDHLQGQVLEATADGAKEVVVAIDGLQSLDSANIRRLIKLLRRTRDAGGEITLAVSRLDLLRTLNVTALDKVFRVIGSAEAA